MKRATRATRAGFTLVEILVVISIIATLTAITLVAVQKTSEGQRNRSSKDQVYKLQQSLDAEYERVVRKCATDQIPQGVVDYCDGDQNRARAVWTAINLRRQFPQDFNEAITPLPAPLNLTPLATFGKVAGKTTGDQSAVLLYIILAEKTVSGGGAMNASADDLSQGMRMKDSNGFEMFADAWGNPVGFVRWFSGNVAGNDTQGSPYTDTVSGHTVNNNKDPLDPRDLVAGWNPSTGDPLRAQKLSTVSTLQFTRKNRLATVYAPGKDKAPLTQDDILGYVTKRFGK